MNFLDQTVEQLSIFQNKEVGQFRNIKLENIKKDQQYAKRLELSVENLNQKLSRLKAQHQKLKNENASLKASNDNHIFINEKLNKALQKMVAKSQQKDSEVEQERLRNKQEKHKEKEEKRQERKDKKQQEKLMRGLEEMKKKEQIQVVEQLEQQVAQDLIDVHFANKDTEQLIDKQNVEDPDQRNLEDLINGQEMQIEKQLSADELMEQIEYSASREHSGQEIITEARTVLDGVRQEGEDREQEHDYLVSHISQAGTEQIQINQQVDIVLSSESAGEQHLGPQQEQKPFN